MRKNAIIMCCYVCVAAAFGGFFRWIQTLTAFEADTVKTPKKTHLPKERERKGIRAK